MDSASRVLLSFFQLLDSDFRFDYQMIINSPFDFIVKGLNGGGFVMIWKIFSLLWRMIIFTAVFALAINIQNLKVCASLGGGIAQAQDQSVLMEYEAWFGPTGVKIKSNSPIKPILASNNMIRFGGGYDSKDESVIEQHYKWFIEMGIDGVVLDHTNNVACTFSSDTFNAEIPNAILDSYLRKGRSLSPEYSLFFGNLGWIGTINSFSKDTYGDQQLLRFLQNALGCRVGDEFQVGMATIKANNENIFRLFSQFATKYGKTIKIVILAGGYEPTAWEPLPSKGGLSGMDLQVQFYASLYRRYPQLGLLYLGKPLLLSYFAAPTAIDLFKHFDARVTNLNWRDFTLRKMGGFMSNQLNVRGFSGIHALGLPRFTQLWTWIDRLRTDPPVGTLGPSYAVNDPTSSGVEAFTVAMANPAVDGWGNAATRVPTTRGDLRNGGETFRSFMRLAKELNPRFLIINQFNEFAEPDQGWDEQTSNDIEPTNIWGNKYLELVKQEVQIFRSGQPEQPVEEESPLSPGESIVKPTSARSLSDIPGWPATSVLDSDVFTIYSSYPITDMNYLTREFLGAWLPGNANRLPHLVTRLRLQSRFAGQVVYGFPRRYRVYLTNEKNTEWTLIGTFSQQPVNGWVELNMKNGSAPRKSWGALIVPVELDPADPAGPYFQMSGVEFVTTK